MLMGLTRDDIDKQDEQQRAVEVERLLQDLDLAIKMSLKTRKDRHGAYWCANVGIQYALLVTRTKLRRAGLR